MYTDLFFQEYYKKMKSAESNCRGVSLINGFDKFYIISIIVYVILYGIASFFSCYASAVICAITTLVLVIYLSFKTTKGKSYDKVIKNQRSFQHARCSTVAQLLKDYKIEEDDAIDTLIERLRDNQPKYKPGGVLKVSVTSVFGLISTILSLLSVKVFSDEAIKKIADKLVGSNETLGTIKSWLAENWESLVVLAVMLFILLIELSYIWHSIIKPILMRKYNYHDEIISDLKAYKLFRKYHESIREEDINKPIKETKIISGIKKFFRIIRNFCFFDEFFLECEEKGSNKTLTFIYKPIDGAGKNKLLTKWKKHNKKKKRS